MRAKRYMQICYSIPGMRYLHQTRCRKEDLQRTLDDLVAQGCTILSVEPC